ncbi:response regulator [Desulfonatronum thiodismutans]|uniref:response regulator n=1 Tax=Desulfonatronum thiodismutans TaxID=159290 RepID=UPI0004ABE41C|nr:response regulator [Desulfonatronum thiodismutans]
MRILLVDDELELVSALAERLAIRGIAADYAITGDQALRMAGENDYDLAVLDVKMPHVSGLELWDQLHVLHPRMRCIFLTGHTSERDFQAGTRAGALYLLKPLKIEVLIQNIRQLLESQGKIG